MTISYKKNFNFFIHLIIDTVNARVGGCKLLNATQKTTVSSRSISCSSIFLFLGGGLRARREGFVAMECSVIVCLSLVVSLGMFWYVLLSPFISAWTDSAPCSPINPAPTWKRLNHGMEWSSRMCIFGRMLVEW